MKKNFDAIVVGGGAAGLMTAWQAGLRGRKILVIELSKKPGRKILMSGGGRCNFTNLNVTAENFVSSNPHFVKSALKRYTAWDFIAKVQEHGIAYHERSHGQLFCDDKAKDILNLLLSECEAVKVELLTKCEVDTVRFDGSYHVQTNRGEFTAPSLVVATGGLSIPKMGVTPFGYDIARQFGLRVLPLRASLVPYTFTGKLKDMFARLSGNAIEATISIGKQSFTEALLFTHRGLSGPVVLQISNYWNEGLPVQIDLMPGQALQPILLQAKKDQPRVLLRSLLTQYLPRNLVAELESLWWKDKAELRLADWSHAELAKTAGQINSWEVIPAGTEGYRTAEVTLGGVDTDCLSSRTMEASSQPGLFFVGEVVDVTGHLGGFNFQWAWSSGFACAQAL